MGKAQRLKRQQRAARDEAQRQSSTQAKARSQNTPAFYLICAFLIVVTLAVYWQVTKLELTNFDDHVYVTNNADVRAGLTREGIRWAFNIGYAGNWHPLTWMSHMLDVELYGLDPTQGLGPGGYHLTSLLLHIANSLLLFVVLIRITGYMWRSGFVAALFAVHPLHVESVAWVAERKDVLSTFFLMLTMLAYVWYVERPELRKYLLVVAAFALGLMSKPMLVTLPLMLLVLDYWPLGRFAQKGGLGQIWKLVWEKAPLFALAVGSGAITVIAQRKGEAVTSAGVISVGVRIANAAMSYVIYIVKMFWPQRLAAYYPHPANAWPTWQVIGSALLLAGMTYFAIRLARSRPYIAAGWFWYVITLVPVIGLVQVGLQARADRYTYIPLIGIFAVIAYGIPDLLQRVDAAARVRALAILAGIVVLALTMPAYKQVGYWRNGETMYRHALAVTENNWFAHNGLGCVLEDNAKELEDSGKTQEALSKNQEAIRHLRQTLAILPQYWDAHNNLAIALMAVGKVDEAIAQYRQVLQAKPDHALTHNNLANALLGQGKVDEAIEHYRQALRIAPKYVDAHYNLAIALGARGDIDGAIAEYRRVLQLYPNDYFNYWARNNLALLLQRKGQIDEAIALLREAVRVNETARIDLAKNAASRNLDLLEKEKAVASRR